MEEARQHSALNRLYWLSLLLVGLGLLALLAAFLLRLPAAGTAFVVLALLGLFTRTLACAGGALSLRKTGDPRSKWLAVCGLFWFAFTALFFVFVVLRQFGWIL